MSGSNRSALIAKMYKVLKQHYKPVASGSARPLLEQMLFACCLENAPHDKAEKTYQHLSTSFFDWNEVRVSTVKELSEAMRDLPDPSTAASNLKRVLQNVFEATYSFDLEAVKKQNIGVGIKRLAKMEGASPFVVAYTTQHALGGHFIPLDRGARSVVHCGHSHRCRAAIGQCGGFGACHSQKQGCGIRLALAPIVGRVCRQPARAGDEDLAVVDQSGRQRSLSQTGPEDSRARRRTARRPEAGRAKSAVEKLDGKAAKGAVDKSGRDGQRLPEKPAGKKEESKHGKPAASKAAAVDAAKKKPPQTKPLPVRPAAKSNRPRSIAVSSAGRSSGHKSPTKQLVKRKPR